jgi:hypothetical protein
MTADATASSRKGREAARAKPTSAIGWYLKDPIDYREVPECHASRSMWNYPYRADSMVTG